MNFDADQLADQIHGVLREREAELRLEQAVYGLDAMDEIAIQTVLASGLSTSYEVAREVHYPGTLGRKLSNRPRCDLVLTPSGRPLRLDSKPATLFDDPNAVDASMAYWLEVKCVYQFRAPDKRHSGYGQQWRSAIVDDLKKIEADTLVKNAGLLVVAFTESEALIAKDLELFEDVLAMKEVLAGFRQSRLVPIVDRMGHRICSATLWPTIAR